jgi:hypothetical protein
MFKTLLSSVLLMGSWSVAQGATVTVCATPDYGFLMLKVHLVSSAAPAHRLVPAVSNHVAL